MIRVIVADDHHLVRKGIRALLEKAGDIEIVGEAEDGQQALELVEKQAPDVLVIDISMPRMNGIQAVERIRAMHVSTQVVILSMHSDTTLVRQSLRAGAVGYLLKRSVTEELLLSIRAAAVKETYLSPAISGSIVADLLTLPGDSPIQGPFEQLSTREREVLQLVAEGKTNNEIAKLMSISMKTVEKHRASLMSKLDVHDMAGLVRVAIKYGMISLDD